jgi:putative glutathione S-transferase
MPAHLASEQTDSGEFQRQEDAFREWISNDGSTAYPAVAGRYHLYVSLACPWASRTVIFRKVKGLEAAIGMTIVDPFRDEKGWAFRDPERTRPGLPLNNLDEFESTDPINEFHYLSEAYAATDPNFEERVTVPVLWDKETKRIVNNCEDDICPMFNSVFNEFARNKELAESASGGQLLQQEGAQSKSEADRRSWATQPVESTGCPPSAKRVDLFPKDIESEHKKLSDFLYDNINNGVYKAGFATRQRPYEISCKKLFDALDEMEKRLTSSRYLFGNRIVEADWRLFCTLVRFDVVYHGHFKCNLRRIVDYPNLQGYLMDLYQQPGIAETVSIDHIKRHYYMTHEEINPTRIVPIGPVVDLTRPHSRERIR